MSTAMDTMTMTDEEVAARLHDRTAEFLRCLDSDDMSAIPARQAAGTEISELLMHPSVPLGPLLHGREWYTEGDDWPMGMRPAADSPWYTSGDVTLRDHYRETTHELRRRRVLAAKGGGVMWEPRLWAVNPDETPATWHIDEDPEIGCVYVRFGRLAIATMGTRTEARAFVDAVSQASPDACETRILESWDPPRAIADSPRETPR